MVGFIKQNLCLGLAADHVFLPDQSDGRAPAQAPSMR